MVALNLRVAFCTFLLVLLYNVVIGQKLIPESDNQNQEVTPSLSDYFPKSKNLPSNTLKLRWVFSAPMNIDQTEDAVNIVRNGEEIKEYPFEELATDLWNEDNTILTLWLDKEILETAKYPIVNKKGLLLPGDRFNIEISKNWLSISGIQLDKNYSFEYLIKEKDVTRPNPSSWDVFLPAVGSLEPLSILISEEINPDQLMETISIRLGDKKVEGKYELRKMGMALFFFPDDSWEHKSYSIEISPFIEDLAGNNLYKLRQNDLDEGNSDQKVIQSSTMFKPIKY